MAKRAQTSSEATAKSRERTGTKVVSVALRADEIKLLDALKGAHGGRKGAILAGLRSLQANGVANEPTPEEALRVFERMVRGRTK
jgi:hypothetical protein